MKAPTFESFMNRCFNLLSKAIFAAAMTTLVNKYTMTKLQSLRQLFKKYPYDRYTTDVTFQQCNRPNGNLQVGKKYYSGKDKLYGYKVEGSVLPNGLAIVCTSQIPGNISGIFHFSRKPGFSF